MSQIPTTLSQIISHTPFWVWLILLLLFKRGSALRHDHEVSIAKSFIMPGIFILWGLDTIVTKFNYPIQLFIVYLLFLAVGACTSLYIYRNKQYYLENHVLMQKGSNIPLIIMMSNFCVKYCLNVLLSIQPSLYHLLSFNLIYGVIAGFTVGLFFGNISKSLQVKSHFIG